MIAMHILKITFPQKQSPHLPQVSDDDEWEESFPKSNILFQCDIKSQHHCPAIQQYHPMATSGLSTLK